MLVNASYREMKRDFETHGDAYISNLSEAILKRQLKPDQFSIRALVEALVPDGGEFVRMCNPKNSMNFAEAANVNTAALGVIAGNIVFSKMMEAYENPAYVLSSLVGTESGRPGEIMPKYIPFGDEAGIVPEGEEYPALTIGESHVQMPISQKEGSTCAVTREAVYEDRTGQILSQAATIGEIIGIRKELRLIDTLIGYTRNAGGYGTLYKWNDTDYAPWQLTSPWINRIASNELVDWTDMQGINNLFANMRDPDTGLPIMLGGKTVLTSPQYEFAAARIFGATEVTFGTPAGTDTTSFAKGPNPVRGYNAVSSALLYDRVMTGGNSGAAASSAANGAAYYYVGDFRKALVWWETFPFKFEQKGMDSEAAFRRDVVMEFKAGQKGIGAWKDPRHLVHSYITL